MNGIFSLERFGRYFIHDLRNAKNKYWISLLVLGLMPLTVYLFTILFTFLLEWKSGSFDLSYGRSCQITALLVALFTCLLNFPVKVYGDLTDRKAGSSWLMLPASIFEKWLSMVLIVTIVLPLCLGALLLGSDALLSLFFGGNGGPIVSWLSELGRELSDSTDGLLNLPVLPLLFAEWAETILVFLLGAIFFKKAKVSKTFLVLIGLGIVASLIAVAVTGTLQIDDEYVRNIGEEKFISKFKNLTIIYYIAFDLVMLLLTYLRLRTLKH